MANLDTEALSVPAKLTHLPVLLSAVQWHHFSFDALSLQQLYDVLQLRSEVFVVEQNCVFQDIDGLDSQAMHVLGYVNSGYIAGSVDINGQQAVAKLVAYARCFAAGVKFDQASIGRVITHASLRGAGAGCALMQQSISCVHTRWGVQPIRIGAQAHLEAFYGKLGFVKTGLPYDEDGIAHIDMLRA